MPYVLDEDNIFMIFKGAGIHVFVFILCLFAMVGMEPKWQVAYAGVGLVAFASCLAASWKRWTHMHPATCFVVGMFWPTVLVFFPRFYRTQEGIREEAIVRDVMRS